MAKAVHRDRWGFGRWCGAPEAVTACTCGRGRDAADAVAAAGVTGRRGRRVRAAGPEFLSPGFRVPECRIPGARVCAGRSRRTR
ncbi:hypothetical protein NKH77_23000 [Streptomyces sp. M19]